MAINNKTERLLTIKKILRNEIVENQEMFLELLSKEGFDLTQATLSRDLSYLSVRKINSGKGKSRYLLPEEDSDSTNVIHPTGYLSMEFSSNLAVIKTLPGFANMLASLIDKRRSKEILGTIAGDDTILLIPTDGTSREDVSNRITLILDDLRNIK